MGATAAPADPAAPWDPLSVADVAELFQGIAVPWWIAGGYAIDLAAGRTTRAHDDIDILILRRDHRIVRGHLAAWECHMADPPGALRPWPGGTALPDQVHDVWCRANADDRWRFQLMVDEVDGARWVSRRDRRITRSVSDIGHLTADGIPYLRPEIQLLYKSRGRRPKDEADLAMALPLLDETELGWLRDAILLTAGDDHPWQSRIAEVDDR